MDGEIVELTFFGPINVCTGFADEERNKITGPGVYIWHYSTPYFERDAFYVGVARKSLQSRVMDHFHNMMGGKYDLRGSDFAIASNPEQAPDCFLASLEEKTKQRLEILRSSNFYFCATDNEPLANTAEVALIECGIVESRNASKNSIFENQNLKGTRRSIEKPLLFRISGPDILTNFFGKEIEYK